MSERRTPLAESVCSTVPETLLYGYILNELQKVAMTEPIPGVACSSSPPGDTAVCILAGKEETVCRIALVGRGDHCQNGFPGPCVATAKPILMNATVRTQTKGSSLDRSGSEREMRYRTLDRYRALGLEGGKCN